jgi:beta-glucanase (GH16 family)
VEMAAFMTGSSRRLRAQGKRVGERCFGSAPNRRRSAAACATAAVLAFSAACTATSSHTTDPATRTTPGAIRSTGTPAYPAASGAWHRVFDGTFPGTSLNTDTWATCYDWNDNGCTNSGNHELEWYEPGQVAVGGGALTLTAQRRTVTGSDGKSYPWVSGMVSTGRDDLSGTPRYTFTYGYISADIKLSVGNGIYPAFWLLPADKQWPPEIDILESTYAQNLAEMNLHYAQGGVDKQAQGYFGPGDFTGSYHNFALDWQPGRLTWYIDGVPRYTIGDPSVVPHTAMEIMLTLAVGLPDTPPTGTDSATLHVKDVQVWQH